MEAAWTLGKTLHLVSRNGCLLRDLFDLVKVFPYLRIPKLVPVAQWSLHLLSQNSQFNQFNQNLKLLFNQKHQLSLQIRMNIRLLKFL